MQVLCSHCMYALIYSTKPIYNIIEFINLELRKYFLSLAIALVQRYEHYKENGIHLENRCLSHLIKFSVNRNFELSTLK